MEIRSIAESIQAVGVTAVAEKQPCEVENIVVAFLAVHQVKMVACIFHEQRVCEQSLSHQFETGELQQKVKAREIDPHTLIHKAILENNAEVIRFLLAHGVDVDYPDENGMSPLTIAILNRCNFAVEVLLKYGANTNPDVLWSGMSLFTLAIDMKDLPMAQLLFEHGAQTSNEDLYKALSYSLNGHEKNSWLGLATRLINEGISLNPLANNPNPLSLAIELALINEDPRILKLMLEKGVDLNCRFPGTSVSPLMKVLMTRSKPQDLKIDIAKLLIEHGAAVNEDDAYYGGPLFFAMSYSFKEEFIKHLIDVGANINQIRISGDPSFIGLTPILYSIKRGSIDYLKIFVEAGADVNLGNPTPIKLALQLNKPEIVQYLLQHGAKS